MPKLKVRKAAKKRYKTIPGKRFIRRKAFKGHILEKKYHDIGLNWPNDKVVIWED